VPSRTTTMSGVGSSIRTTSRPSRVDGPGALTGPPPSPRAPRRGRPMGRYHLSGTQVVGRSRTELARYSRIASRGDQGPGAAVSNATRARIRATADAAPELYRSSRQTRCPGWPRDYPSPVFVIRRGATSDRTTVRGDGC
jgi:hypothetical protein